MPKREATPPPGDDEPRYLTIVYPYPPHANMEIQGDRLALACWLACCMGTSDDLYAIFHKPSSGNMIIIEVRRDHPRFRNLLGAHRWSDFVKKPGKHHSMITRIYFSTFHNGRAVEKAGWKRIFVADNWFKGFSPNNRFITHPYPLSTYCDLPSEDQTGVTLYRPIPREMFAIQIPTPPPVPVGSATWVERRGQSGTGKTSHAVSASGNRAPNNSGQSQHRAFNLPELKMPIPSSAFASAMLSPASSANHSSNGVYHRASPASRSQSAGAGGSSGHGSQSSFLEDHDSAGSRNGFITGGYYDAPGLEDEFGTLSFRPTANKDGKPLCPSHGVVCKKGICRDYADLLKKIEREQEKKRTPFNSSRGGPTGTGRDKGFAIRGRGRGIPLRARGSSGRGRASPRGMTVAGGRGRGW